MYTVAIYDQATGEDPAIGTAKSKKEVTDKFVSMGGAVAPGQDLFNGEAHHTGTGHAFVVKKDKDAPKKEEPTDLSKLKVSETIQPTKPTPAK